MGAGVAVLGYAQGAAVIAGLCAAIALHRRAERLTARDAFLLSLLALLGVVAASVAIVRYFARGESVLGAQLQWLVFPALLYALGSAAHHYDRWRRRP